MAVYTNCTKKIHVLQAKNRHYNIVIKTEAPHASETLTLSNKAHTVIIQKEWKIIRDILGPWNVDEG